MHILVEVHSRQNLLHGHLVKETDLGRTILISTETAHTLFTKLKSKELDVIEQSDNKPNDQYTKGNLDYEHYPSTIHESYGCTQGCLATGQRNTEKRQELHRHLPSHPFPVHNRRRQSCATILHSVCMEMSDCCTR